MSRHRESVRVTPAYLATGGRSSTYRNLHDPLTRLVRCGAFLPEGLDAPLFRLLEALVGGTLTLADTAVFLCLPLSAVRVLAGDLVDAGLIDAIPPAQLPEVELLERVLRGLTAARQRELA